MSSSRPRFTRALLALVLTLTASAASGQVWLSGIGKQTSWVPYPITTAPAFSFPTTNLYALYSTRKALSTYAGNAINVTRVSDSTSTDIGFSGSDFNVGAFNTFCAGTQCLVTKWYDQSGNGRDLTESGSGIVRGTNVQVANGKAYLNISGQRLNATTFFPGNADLTVGFAGSWLGGAGNASGWLPVNNFDGTNGYFLTLDGLNDDAPGEFTFWANTGGEVHTTGALVHNQMGRYVVTRASNAVTLYVNGTSKGTGTSAGATPTTSNFAFGQLPSNTTFAYQGTFAEMYIYSAALSGTNLGLINTSEASYFPDLGFATPFSGSVAGIQAQNTQGVATGAHLQFENTQPWTAYSAIQMWGGASQSVVGGIIFTTVANNTTDAGYELWIDNTCHAVVRIIHDYGGNQYIDVRAASNNLCDYKKHFVAAKYTAATKTAADVSLYIDGAIATPTTVKDTLGGLTLTPAGQTFQVNTQYGQIPLAGIMNFFQLDTVAQSDAYITSHMTAGNFPAANGGGNPGVSYVFQEGTGTTTADGSGNGFTGTLTSATMWVP